MTRWLCVFAPGRQLFLCEADNPAEAARKCDEATGAVSPDSNVLEVMLATPAPLEDGRPYAIDGMGSWFGVADLEVRIVPRSIHDADEVEEILNRPPHDVLPRERRLSYEQWSTRYAPETNFTSPHASFNGCLYETYGDDLTYVERCPATRVWTLIDADGTHVIVPGRHIINRIGYFVTRRAFGLTSAPVGVYVNPDPAEEPTAYLHFSGFTETATADGARFTRRYHKNITIAISPPDGHDRIYADTGARARVLPNGDQGEPATFDVSIDDLAWLPQLEKSAAEWCLKLIEEPLERLTAEYSDWLVQNDLQQLSADELILENLEPAFKVCLTDFIHRWEEAERAYSEANQGHTE